MRSPILFLVFNRPEKTREVFGAIRAARPPRLYVAADGARPGRHEEFKRCEEVRTLATKVDWPCEVFTLFRTENLGCKTGVATAVDWFFEHETEGIVLEDDILPLPTFFDFCDEMLERYRTDTRVGMVSGCNMVSSRFTTESSYFFSRYNHIWGWAGWRRAWQHYDVSMKAWPAWRDAGGLGKIGLGNVLFTAYWRQIFDSVYAGDVDTWDYQWAFACWRMDALAILPALNQTTNLGFGAGATHTNYEAPQYIRDSPAKPLGFPLQHPVAGQYLMPADALIASQVFGITVRAAIRRWLSARSRPLRTAIKRIKSSSR